MHIRFSNAKGLPVLDDTSDEHIANISSILLEPDKGTVEGFFVSIPCFLSSDVLFLSTFDIIHWGAHVRVSHADVLSPLEERVRLWELAEQGRTILGQKIVSEAGKIIGTCRDVQFNTKTFTLEWIFPRRLLHWGIPIPASAIIEVKPEAVIVRERSAMSEEPTMRETVLAPLEELKKTPTAG